MAIVRTVLGDIDADALGVCYAHEHIIIDDSLTTDRNPAFLINSVDKASQELKQFYADGGRAVVDSMPCDCGRSVLKLAEVSQNTGVSIVAPTGLHLAKYYDSGHWGNLYNAQQLADLFVADIQQGIDIHDYTGPIVQRSPHKAGLIKVATDLQWTRREQRSFGAAATAHTITGAPILTHTEEGSMGLEQVEFLQGYGVDLGHVVISHLDRKPDLSYHREILSTGVKVEYDSAFRWKDREDNPTLDLVIGLLEEFPNQIMLGMDTAKFKYWKSYGGAPGLSFLLIAFTQQLLEAGLTQAQWNALFIENPKETYSFIDKR